MVQMPTRRYLLLRYFEWANLKKAYGAKSPSSWALFNTHFVQSLKAWNCLTEPDVPKSL